MRHFRRNGPFKPRDMGSKVIRLNKLIRDLSGKEDWFQQNPEDEKPREPMVRTVKRQTRNIVRKEEDLRKTIAVMSVPKTPGGCLARDLRRIEASLRAVCTTKVKISEKVGRTLRQALFKADPW